MQLIGLAIAMVTLVILFLQNRATVIALHFLGMQTITLPLAIWVVSAVVVGLVTGWLMAGLLQAALLFHQRRLKTQVRELQLEVDRLSEANGGNWVEEEDLGDRPNGAPYEAPQRDYEVPQTPSSTLQDGSRYSYSYRDRQSFIPDEPRRSQVAEPPEGFKDEPRKKTVDAEYRVLVPPPPESGVSRQEPINEAFDDDEDDWDFDEDTSSDWDNGDRSRSGSRDRQ